MITPGTSATGSALFTKQEIVDGMREIFCHSSSILTGVRELAQVMCAEGTLDVHTYMRRDLNADSLSIVEVVGELERRFGLLSGSLKIPNDDHTDITLGTLVDQICKILHLQN